MLTFHLTMQILYDEFQNYYQHMRLHGQADTPCLEGVRLYREKTAPLPQYVYLATEEDLSAGLPSMHGLHLILLSKSSDNEPAAGNEILIIEDASDPADVLTQAQDIFEKYFQWDRSLHQALNDLNPLDNMLNACLNIFQNPIFIHDSNFFILSCPHTVPGMISWDKDPRTGMDIAPLSLIHDFRADLEYLHTLSTVGPALYSAELRGYPILYINLWNEGRYEGRICVDELETPLLPGHYQIIQYLSEVILNAIRKKSLYRLGMGGDLIQFFREFLDQGVLDESRVINCLSFLGWKRHDHYLCLCLETDQPDVRMHSSAATLSYIETQIRNSFAFLYDNRITVIANLSPSGARSSDVLRSLAMLLREELLKMGASSELVDFFQLPQGYLQAKTVLQLGRRSHSMHWYYRFEDYLLEYLLQKGGEVFSPELLCSAKLLALKQYDQENHTDLFHTLKVFLERERNVLQTSKLLYIHRSTLFYRLERIQKIADVNLDDAKERLVLRISYYIMEQNEDNAQ